MKMIYVKRTTIASESTTGCTLTFSPLADSSILENWMNPFVIYFKGCLVYFFILFLIDIPVCNVSPYQMPHSAASDLVLHCNKLKFCLFVLRVYGSVNSYGHVEPISYPLTLFLGRLRPTKRLTST